MTRSRVARGWRAATRAGLAPWLLAALLTVAGCRTPDAPPTEPAPAAAPAPLPRAALALGLDADELAAIVAHGPWPPPFRPDPTNRASGDPAAIELGRRLFDDPRPSFDGRRRCADCHRAELGFADGRARPARPRPPRRHRGAACRPVQSPRPLERRPHPDAAVRTRHVVPSHRNFGEFRVPGLRALALTAL